MMSLTNETHVFDRVAKKKAKNVMLSRELLGVLAQVTDERGESAFIEQAAWNALLDEYGQDDIVDAVENVQASLDDDKKLAEAKPYTLQRV